MTVIVTEGRLTGNLACWEALGGKGFAIRKRRHGEVSQHLAGGVLWGRLPESAYGIIDLPRDS